ncbi:MAG: NAD(P)-dependent oxidoreductase [Cyclobacteriaceae bacterium]
MKYKVIIIGASGTLGTYLVDQLTLDGTYDICACANRNLNQSYYKSKGIKSYKLDITNKADFKNLPTEGVKAVVQIAGVMPSRMKGYNPSLYLDVNIMGTLNVLEYCRQNNVEKYIFTQSHSDVAGHWNSGKKIAANAPRSLHLKGDHAVYIVSKNAAVDLSHHYYQDYGINNVILRLPTIYSHRPINDMFVDGKEKVMAYRYLIDLARKGKDLEIWGDPEITKDIVYVKDFVQMVSKAISSQKANGFYNVAYGEGITLRDQILGLAKVFNPAGSPSKIVYRPKQPSQTSYLYDISNAEKDLDYSPEYDYLSMLKDMKKEMLENRFSHLAGGNNIYS